jgi:hypothetical protein
LIRHHCLGDAVTTTKQYSTNSRNPYKHTKFVINNHGITSVLISPLKWVLRFSSGRSYGEQFRPNLRGYSMIDLQKMEGNGGNNRFSDRPDKCTTGLEEPPNREVEIMCRELVKICR